MGLILHILICFYKKIYCKVAFERIVKMIGDFDREGCFEN